MGEINCAIGARAKGSIGSQTTVIMKKCVAKSKMEMSGLRRCVW